MAEMQDLLILFGMALAMGAVLLWLNTKVGSAASKFVSYAAMWCAFGLAAWTLLRVAMKVG